VWCFSWRFPAELRQERSGASARVTFRFSLSTNNQKEGHPMLAPSGHPVLRVRDRLRDSPTRHPCRDGERCASCTSPCGSYPPALAAPQGPLCRQRIHALSSAHLVHPSDFDASNSLSWQITKNSCASDILARKRMDALPEMGPLRSGGRGRSTRRAARTMRAVFRWHKDVPSKNSVAAREPFAHGCAKGAELGVPFLLVTFRWASNEK
jgi:hypothetical protein